MKKNKLFLIFILAFSLIIYSIVMSLEIKTINIGLVVLFIMGVILLLYNIILNSIILKKKSENNRIITWLVFLIKTTIIFMGLSFTVYAMTCIYARNHIPASGIDAMIILGAGINGEKPGETLKGRLDEGIKYLSLNKNTKVIVSGGIGYKEKMSEALVMKNYLIRKGIDPYRIIEENASANTKENIKYSKDIFKSKYKGDNNNTSVVIVSNEFHICRSISITKEIWKGEIDFIASKSISKYMPYFLAREYTALFVKYKNIYMIYMGILMITYNRKRKKIKFKL